MKFETVLDVQDLARGSVLLGTGGGGDPYVGEMFVMEQIRQGRYPSIVSAQDLPDDAFVVSIAAIGAPTVIVEQLVSAKALMLLLERAEELYGRKIDALISAEIGGANSVFPLALAAISGVPVVDADGIGRAFPQIEMTTFNILGLKATPLLVMDDAGDTVTVRTTSSKLAEEIVRFTSASMGSLVFSVLYPMTGKQVRECAVLGTLTHAYEIGKAIRRGREEGDPFESLLASLRTKPGRIAQVIFDGKISDVARATRDGWTHAAVTIEALDGSDDVLTIDVKNEFLIAKKNGRPITLVPDLITVVDRETAEPLTGEMLAYGQRIKVISYAVDSMLRTPDAIKVTGPRAFGFDMDFVPLEQLLAAEQA